MLEFRSSDLSSRVYYKQKMVYKCVMKAGQEHKPCVGVGAGLVLSFAADSYFRH